MAFSQFERSSRSQIVFFDTLKVDNIVYADSATGILYKKNNKVIIREIIQILQTDIINHPLSEDMKTILVYDDRLRKLDWVYYEIGNLIFTKLKSRQFVENGL